MLQDKTPMSETTSGLSYQEGLEAGIEAGIEEGTLMAMRAVLMRCLARRGVADDFIRLKVADETDADRLTWWIDQVVDTSSPDTLRHLFVNSPA